MCLSPSRAMSKGWPCLPFRSCSVTQSRLVLMHQRKSQISNSVGEGPISCVSFVPLSSTEGRPPSDLLHESDQETPLVSRTITQSPKCLMPDLPTLSVSSPSHPVRLHCAARQHAIGIDCGGNIFDDNQSENTTMVSPAREIAIDEDDIIVAVMGPTGAGKSTLISRAVGGTDIGVGHDLRSCTSEIRAVRCPHSDGERNIVLVDTPGFDDTFVTDTQILLNIANWLKKTYKQNVKLSGLLYLHRISDNRVAGTPLRNLNMFKELCGEDNFKNVILVTTMWDEVEEDVGLQREEELRNTFWQWMIKLGSSSHRFNDTEESARKIINSISVSPPGERYALQIQREMVDQHKPVHLTSAGKVVLDSFSSLFTSFKRLFKRIWKRPRRKKYNVSLDSRSLLFQRLSSLHSMASTATLCNSISDKSDCTTSSGSSYSGTCMEYDYGEALGFAITNLRLALNIANFVDAPCLEGAIIPSINIALTVARMERAHHGLYQIVENAALLINVITEHARKVCLSSNTKEVINEISKLLVRIEAVIQHAAQETSPCQEVFQDDNDRTISSCTNSMRMACSGLQSMLPVENRHALCKIEGNLTRALRGLEECCRCDIGRVHLRHHSV